MNAHCSKMHSDRVVLLLWDAFTCAAELTLLTGGPPFFAYYHCFYAVVHEIVFISGNSIVVLNHADIHVVEVSCPQEVHLTFL